MKTTHKIVFGDAREMSGLPDQSVDLVVTSPPYPMIEMWDAIFSRQNHQIEDALANNDGPLAFELMHAELDEVWRELFRVLKDGGIVCINIGDATRTINGRFALYTNHSRIHSSMQQIGFSALPVILWRKQTNAPNKFMGSGMMPPGAYVTLEHEYILILRKGKKKEFKTEEKKRVRRESSFFWEERNNWFSDVWTDLKGASQELLDKKVRKRSAAFPVELPYRLISMFSIKMDTVLDPFLGVGTTIYAAMATGRNSVGFELDANFSDLIYSGIGEIVKYSRNRISERIKNHCGFVEEYFTKKGKFKHINKYYLFPVITGQETDIIFNELVSLVKIEEGIVEATYSDEPQDSHVGEWGAYLLSESEKEEIKSRSKKKLNNKGQQLLF